MSIFGVLQAERFKKEQPTQDQMVMLALEVLYLWNAIPTCTKADLEKMLEGNKKHSPDPLKLPRCFYENSNISIQYSFC